MCTSRVVYCLSDLNEACDLPGPELGLDWDKVLSQRRENGEDFPDPFHT